MRLFVDLDGIRLLSVLMHVLPPMKLFAHLLAVIEQEARSERLFPLPSFVFQPAFGSLSKG